MEKQEFITLVEESILKLEKQSALGQDKMCGCHYLSKDTGHRCIVGQMLTDSQAKEADSQGQSDVSTLIEHEILPCFFNKFTEEQQNHLISLQGIHDGSDDFSDVIKSLYRYLEKKIK